MPAMGFGMGIERTILTLQENGIEIPKQSYIDLYIGAMSEEAKIEALKLINLLRERNIKCDFDHMNRSVKAEMKYANKIEARFTIILGENELQSGVAKLKRMNDGEQFEVNIKDLEGIINLIN
jgi:histidyl-tRNA synthetase